MPPRKRRRRGQVGICITAYIVKKHPRKEKKKRMSLHRDRREREMIDSYKYSENQFLFHFFAFSILLISSFVVLAILIVSLKTFFVSFAICFVIIFIITSSKFLRIDERLVSE
jgi:hypothetical protein